MRVENAYLIMVRQRAVFSEESLERGRMQLLLAMHRESKKGIAMGNDRQITGA